MCTMCVPGTHGASGTGSILTGVRMVVTPYVDAVN